MIKKKLLKILVCPDCREKITIHKNTYCCESCGRVFEITHNTIHMLPNYVDKK